MERFSWWRMEQVRHPLSRALCGAFCSILHHVKRFMSQPPYNTWHLWNVSVELHSEIRGKPSILQMRPGLKPMPYILASKWKNDLLTLEMFTLTPELDMPWFGKQFHHWYQPVDLHREKFTSGISRSLDLIRHPAGRGCRTSVRHASLCG